MWMGMRERVQSVWLHLERRVDSRPMKLLESFELVIGHCHSSEAEWEDCT